MQAQPSAAADDAAGRALGEGYRLADRLLGLYVAQVFDTRLAETGALPDTRFAARFARGACCRLGSPRSVRCH